jgi:hypothetical protein
VLGLAVITLVLVVDMLFLGNVRSTQNMALLGRKPAYKTVLWILSEAIRLAIYVGAVGLLVGTAITLFRDHVESEIERFTVLVGWVVNFPFILWLHPGTIDPAARSVMEMFTSLGAITLGFALGVIASMVSDRHRRPDAVSIETVESIAGVVATGLGVVTLLIPLLWYLAVGLDPMWESAEVLAIHFGVGCLALSFFLIGDDLRARTE